MYLLDLSGQILRDMWRHKLRSTLALFGIIWGTVAVVLLLAIGTGFSAASQKSMMGIVDGSIFAAPFKTSISYHGIPKGTRVNLKASSVMALPHHIAGIQMVTPVFINRKNLSYGGKSRNKEVVAVASSFGYLQKINVASGGRFLNKLDIKQRAKVVVLGDKIKEQLFGAKPALGQQMSINHVNFTVIGLLQPASKNVYNWYKNKAIIPYSTYINMFGNQNIAYFLMLPKSTANSTTIKQSMRTLLAHQYHYNKTDKVALTIFDTTKVFQFVRMFFLGLNIFLGICGGLTLGVGSLGIANIMFLIVTERTREIGMRMAIGARDYHILGQILLEALVITGLGGIIGFLISYGTVTLLQSLTLPSWLGVPTISIPVVVTTIIILMLFGLLAGFFPARRAAKMDPVEALGH